MAVDCFQLTSVIQDCTNYKALLPVLFDAGVCIVSQWILFGLKAIGFVRIAINTTVRQSKKKEVP